MLSDVRVAVRRLFQSPGYALATVATLALTIGACTAVFSAVRTILLKTYAIGDPEQLVVVWGADPSRSLPVVELSYRNFADWTTGSSSLVQAAAMGSSAWPTILESPGTPSRVSSAGVTASFFATLRVAPIMGRVFRLDDERPNAPRVIVISHRLWIRRFGGDPHTLGRLVRIADAPHAIVGIMPSDFDFPRGSDVWMPAVPIIASSPTGWNEDGFRNVGVLYAIGRLRPGVTIASASDELERRAVAFARNGGAPRFGTRLVITPFADYLFGPTRQVLWLLLASVLVLLVIGCSNIASVMLTRASDRELEHGVRLAFGATPFALARAWLVEAFLCSVAGGLAGLGVALALVRMIVLLAPDDVPRVSHIAVDSGVVTFCFAATFVTSLLCGMLPARRAASNNPAESLVSSKRMSAGPRALRVRSVLVVAQVGLAVVLLIAAGLIVRSFANLQTTNIGFAPSGVIALNVTPRTVSGPPNAWMAQLVSRLRSLPGVEAAGAVFLRPLSHGPIGQDTWIALEGQAPDGNAARDNPLLNYEVATTGYFQTMRIALQRGRLFSDEDIDAGRPVALISESAASRLWPRGDAVGKRVLLPTFSPQGPDRIWRTVVGVVANVRYRGLDDDQRLDIYAPASREALTTSDVMVRGSGDPGGLARTVQAEIRRLDPDAVIDSVASMDDVVRRARAPWALGAWMFTLFAVLALLLAAVGMVGLLSLEVSQRRHEFAVRQAVGADRGDILRRVFRRTVWRATIGTATGVIAALAGARLLGSMLYGIDAADPTTYLIVAATVIVIACASTVIPARRAADTSPIELLRG